MKKYRVIFGLSVFVIFILILLNNPLRRSEQYLRVYVLDITPLGTVFDDVLSSMHDREWELVSANDSSGFYHQGIEPNKFVGEKSIRASLGDYQGIPLETNVTVFWGFDSQGKLIDIWVWKTRNGL